MSGLNLPNLLRRLLRATVLFLAIWIAFSIVKVAVKKEAVENYECFGSSVQYQWISPAEEVELERERLRESVTLHGKAGLKYWLDGWDATLCRTSGSVVRCERTASFGNEVRSFDMSKKTLSYSWFRQQDEMVIRHAADALACRLAS